MSTETKAALVREGTPGQQTSNYDSSGDKLLADLKVVVSDGQELMKEAADCTADGYRALRTQFESRLVETKAKLGRAVTAVGEKAKYSTEATHAYVQQHPWKAVGFSAVAGAIVGFFIRRR